MNKLFIKCFFDKSTNTATYLIADTSTNECAIIDSVLSFDMSSGATSTSLADEIISFISLKQWQCRWILETHAHADHLTAAAYLKRKIGGQIAIGEHIVDVQKIFGSIFNFEAEFNTNGEQFDRLLSEGDIIELGEHRISVLHTPGHTPACVTYLIDDIAFVGDTLFMPDYGTARCDFPGGNAETLYQSIQKILSLPDNTRLFLGHDYMSDTRDTFQWQSSVGEQKRDNIHISQYTSPQDYVRFRQLRDKKLSMPKLLLPSVQVNIRAGDFPPTESNGTVFLKLPINVLK